ncbi:hypothetical protein ES703_86515 [subsurface metagenome]
MRKQLFIMSDTELRHIVHSVQVAKEKNRTEAIVSGKGWGFTVVIFFGDEKGVAVADPSKN